MAAYGGYTYTTTDQVADGRRKPITSYNTKGNTDQWHVTKSEIVVEQLCVYRYTQSSSVKVVELSRDNVYGDVEVCAVSQTAYSAAFDEHECTTVPKRKKKLKAEPSRGEGTAVEENTDQESSLASDGNKLESEELVLKEKEEKKENKHEVENDGENVEVKEKKKKRKHAEDEEDEESELHT
ncbi:hypothetical protein V6N13_067245 [Hibiscus sabdariffa]